MIELLTGSAFGLLGSAVTNIFGLLKQKQVDKQEVTLRRIDLEAMDKEYEFRDRGAARDADTALTISADSLMKESFGHDAASYSKGVKPNALGAFLLVVVDFVRGLTRSGLTIYLIWQVHSTRTEVQGVLDSIGASALDATTALDIYQQVVKMTLFLASAAISWWFGTRGKGSQQVKL